MSSIGIIANPASGKDIRRLVSHATIIDNHEKINIVKRIILGAQKLGVDQVYIMPDTYNTGYKALDGLDYTEELVCKVTVLEMKLNANLHDTIEAARMMEELGVGCILVIGGDGTSRAAAKSITSTPIISISTGTNNVYPEMTEGTVAGMAAAVVASGKYPKKKICKRNKRIEIYKDNKLIDIALIDAVISKNIVAGSKAIWNLEDMVQIIVSKAHPASIGFSSIVGCKEIIKEKDDYGASIKLTEDKHTIIAPIAAGILQKVHISDPKILKLNEPLFFEAQHNGMIAIDGEREVPFYKGDELVFKITRKGPFRVNIKKALEVAQKDGFYSLTPHLNSV